MSDYYIPTLEDLKEAWIGAATSGGDLSLEDAAAGFDRTMDEFGNENYEDGFSEGVAYAGQPEYVEGPRPL